MPATAAARHVGGTVSSRMMNEPTQEYRTSDTGLASFLVTIGRQIQRIEGTRSRREFVFAGVTDEDRRAYLNDSLVPARTMFNAYKSLLNTISAMA